MKTIEIKENRWLRFIEWKHQPKKTKTFLVMSKCSDCKLGEIHWYSKWRHYTFSPTTDYKTEYSDRCQFEIGEFIANLNKEHKRGK